ncbi:MAG: precorrin-3B C(17)-methyltransferase [Verrucomicrobia bacterium]|nr:precorrin-3B C(17)-methyltransferase [Verrucomicrobiota bacterium]
MKAKLHLVSVGPGFHELIPVLAERALRSSDAIVGYELYLRWITDWIAGKEIHALPLTQERERAGLAIDLARAGRSVSLVSGGDVGVYGMAALALEMMDESDAFDVAVVPGISAANSCAARLGSPLSHDFATLSLSDLLCPWAWIEERARRLAEADFVVALYNVQSRGRHDGIYRVLRIFSEQKAPGTWCGVVRNAYREGEEVSICTLDDLFERRFDMLTTIIVGNRFTRRRRGNFLYTPRGYHAWPEPATGGDRERLPAESIWVFAGTSDGNDLAAALAGAGHRVVVSVASDYGREAAGRAVPGVAVCAGRMGPEGRKRTLTDSAAVAIVDATHPFAAEISRQLMGIAQDTGIPYLRYERPVAEPVAGAHYRRSAEEAAATAAALGRRIFLAVGVKDLATFLRRSDEDEREWYVRLAPDALSIEKALDLGVPRSRICAMQGPFSRAFNLALWRDWAIDCVVTKDSGEAGGFPAKAEAAAALGSPLVVLERPAIPYPFVARDFGGILGELARINIRPPLSIPNGTAS